MPIDPRRFVLRLILAATCAGIAAAAATARATGVPVDGFLPLVGIGLTDEFEQEDWFAMPSTSPIGGTLLSAGGAPHYDLALLDTGAQVTLLTTASDVAFGLEDGFPQDNDGGFHGTETITLGGATGFVDAVINDPLGLYAGGLQGNPGGASLVMPNSALKGQTNTALLTVPPESSLPNVLGLPFSSQYATQIRNDQPQFLTVAGQTVRTPAISFLPRGSGGQGIARRAPMSLNPGSAFAIGPFYLSGLSGEFDEFYENPFQPTITSGGLFLNVLGKNTADGMTHQLSSTQFFFDTGASVTVLSELTALNLGIDVGSLAPEFTIAIDGSAGTKLDVPGYFLDELTVQAIGGSVTIQNVPVLVLNVTNVADPGNFVAGIIGTNFLSGRNLVIDPDPSLGGGNPGPHLYISDPVTVNASWTAIAASATWNTGSNWSAAPGTLVIANARHVSGGNQEAVVSSDSTVWEVNVSGAAANQRMTVRVAAGAMLRTFTGLNVEQHGVVELAGGLLDVQYVAIRDGGRLTGFGSIVTGSGQIAGQVENVNGFVAPGSGAGVLAIEGRFSNQIAGTVEIELGGTAAAQFDRLAIDGPAVLDGILAVTLINGFVPLLGNQFAILAAEAVTGEFAVANLPALTGNKAWHLGYNDQDVTLRVVYPGDFNGDGSVNSADLATWKEGAGVKYSGADFLVWQRNLGLSVSFVASVPEPATGGLALLAALAMARVRRVPLRVPLASHPC